MKDFKKLYKYCKLLSWKEFSYLTDIYFNGFKIPKKLNWFNDRKNLEEFDNLLVCWHLGLEEI